MGKFLDDLEKQAVQEELLRANSLLQRQLEKAKVTKATHEEAVFRAAVDAFGDLKLDPVEKPERDRRIKGEEVAVAWLSDWQLAKVTATYNTEICEERIRRYAEKVVALTEIQRADHPVKKCVVVITGDLIEGELIFPGQHWLIDSSLYRQICVDGPRILGNFLRTMLANFDSVEVHAVIGNHGRLGGRASRDMNPESNGDRMLYRITEQLLAGEKRLVWNIPDGDRDKAWHTVASIGNYKAMLLHGDQFRSFSILNIRKAVLGWYGGAVTEEFNEVLFGHWHQPSKFQINKIVARCSGSPESDNEYAVESLSAIGEASQNLLFVHPEKGIVTAEYCVWLSDE